MFGEGIIIGLLLGKLNGGRLRNLERLSIRAWPLILSAFVLQIYPIFFGKDSLYQGFQLYSYAISYLLLIICVVLNLNQKGVWLILVGLLMNAAVVFLNQMRMPISFSGLEMAGLQEMMQNIQKGEILYYIPLDSAKNWTKILGKYIVIPKPYPFAKVVSIGDLLMTVGLVLWIRGKMMRSIFSQKAEMLRFKYKR